MKKCLGIAVLLVMSTAAQAQYTFDYGGRTITIDPAQEADRLAQKYGSEAVINAFGANFKSAIAKELAAISKGDAPESEEPEIDADVPGQNKPKKAAAKKTAPAK